MSVTVEVTGQSLEAHRSLPLSVRALYVASVSRPPHWLASAWQADSASNVDFLTATCMADALARLRDEVFDAVFISHEPPEVDALELVEAMRAGGSEEQAIIVIGSAAEQEMSALCFEAGADDYACADTCTPRELLWTLTRSLDYRRLIAENRRLRQLETHRRELEQDESHRLISQQKRLIENQVAASCTARIRSPEEFPPQLVDHYRELLRTYVIMGSGNIAKELQELVKLQLSAGTTAQEAMLLHVHVLEEMVQGLGNRSSRHVLNRADVLILEMMIHLSDGYRQRLHEYLHPPEQQLLPFMEE